MAATILEAYRDLFVKVAFAHLATLMPDGMHPNQSTYRLKGEFAAKEFQNINR